MPKPIYIAAYHQSKFGKLMAMTVPEIVAAAVNGVCREIDVPASVSDVASIGSACSFTLNRQGLLAGLVASVPGMEAKPIESVENACASGGQAVLSVIYKLLGGLGDVGVAVGYEKMRDNDGQMDGKIDRRGPRILLAPRRPNRQSLRLPSPLRRNHAVLPANARRNRSRSGADRRRRIRKRQT